MICQIVNLINPLSLKLNQINYSSSDKRVYYSSIQQSEKNSTHTTCDLKKIGEEIEVHPKRAANNNAEDD